MSDNLMKIIDYIDDNFLYGSSISAEKIYYLFNKYHISNEDKQIVFDELESLKITMFQTKKTFINRLKDVDKLFGIYKECDENSLNKWYKSKGINDEDKLIIRNYLDNNGYSIINNKNNHTKSVNLDFLDEFEEESLDALLDSTNFNKEVDQLNEVVSKSNNKLYLNEYHLNDKYSLKKLDALDKLVRANSKLVWKVVFKYKKFSTIAFDLNDMYQVGMQGLIKAAEKFNLSFENEFSTYAVWWIRQSITRGIANYSNTIRIPVHVRDKIVKLIKIENNFWNTNSRQVTNEELSKIMNLSINDIVELKMYKEISNIVSLEISINNEDNSSLKEFIADNNTTTPEELLDEKTFRNEIRSLLNEILTQKEIEIISLRFGLDDGQIRTLEEIGKVYNVTRERIRQIESKSLEKLQNRRFMEGLGNLYYER
ncbi:hypothetical protein BG261_01885 [Floricoccus tropicus]|uniref:RNA polymerase sigma-70 domain-containing protein n=1 Tax=Floricoccus tropicus TaxID=1859473 RepID=A0A1E8GMW0_9LACT|nr:RNA polymerase sigma factor RpoD/SigA [Floricoccus tropicus]OFI49356.1 hypothetical protein BG261_01885 [Floricoccus tropicus]